MSTLWSVFYGVLLANVTFYLFDLAVHAIKSAKNKRDLDTLWESIEDFEDED
jgi:hypothetical protein